METQSTDTAAVYTKEEWAERTGMKAAWRMLFEKTLEPRFPRFTLYSKHGHTLPYQGTVTDAAGNVFAAYGIDLYTAGMFETFYVYIKDKGMTIEAADVFVDLLTELRWSALMYGYDVEPVEGDKDTYRLLWWKGHSGYVIRLVKGRLRIEDGTGKLTFSCAERMAGTGLQDWLVRNFYAKVKP